MPRIHDQFAQSVMYVYRSLADARAGEQTGGSAFMVGIPVPGMPDWADNYVVTNRHVIQRARRKGEALSSPVLRMNRKDGTVEYFETAEEQWFFHPDGDDIAVFPFDFSDASALKISTIPGTFFITPRIVAKEDIGIGDDIFMLGRFVNHEGKQQNTPAIRFGNIAMMPIEKIVSENGLAQESFLVETRSLPGYSGSPVFIFSTNADMDHSERDFSEEQERIRSEFEQEHGHRNWVLDPAGLVGLKPKGPYLLGIDWCHLHMTEKVLDQQGEVYSEKLFVRSNAGMAGVIPAWKIAEVFDLPELVQMRKEGEDKLKGAAQGNQG